VVELIDINLLIAACCDQAELAQRLAMQETARRLHWATA
jgi:hypothetical protein